MSEEKPTFQVKVMEMTTESICVKMPITPAMRDRVTSEQVFDDQATAILGMRPTFREIVAEGYYWPGWLSEEIALQWGPGAVTMWHFIYYAERVTLENA